MPLDNTDLSWVAEAERVLMDDVESERVRQAFVNHLLGDKDEGATVAPDEPEPEDEPELETPWNRDNAYAMIKAAMTRVGDAWNAMPDERRPSLGAPEWLACDREIQAAYDAQDTMRLAHAVMAYERYAASVGVPV